MNKTTTIRYHLFNFSVGYIFGVLAVVVIIGAVGIISMYFS